MAVVFSFPAFVPSPDYTIVGYNITKSSAIGNNINPYGPWNAFLTGTTQNLNVVDAVGTQWDLYRVAPVINITATNQTLTLPQSRPFTSITELFDPQISALLSTFRQSWMYDPGVAATDSSIPTESTGIGAAPFITDTDISRFYLSFVSNTAPVKFRESDVVVYLGASPPGATLVPYTDYYPNSEGGYIDFKTNPAPTDYLKVEYTAFDFNDDELRNMLINAISGLSLYGITDQTYDVQQSWNYTYLTSPLPNRDVGKIICAIAAKEYVGGLTLQMGQEAEAWRIGSTSFTSDPSRAIQGVVQYQLQLHNQINQMSNMYIINTRNYFTRGEFDSFFDNSGIMYPPFSVYNVFNYMSWWL